MARQRQQGAAVGLDGVGLAAHGAQRIAPVVKRVRIARLQRQRSIVLSQCIRRLDPARTTHCRD